MSSEMDFDQTVVALREGRTMRDDFAQNWTGAMVGRHLFRAGLMRIRGQSYQFPGYIYFPIHLFDGSEAQLPFKVVDSAGRVNLNFATQMLTLHEGLQEYYSMQSHYTWYGLEINDRANARFAQQPENIAEKELIQKHIVSEWKDSRRPNGNIPQDVQQFIDSHPNIYNENVPVYADVENDVPQDDGENMAIFDDGFGDDPATLRQEAQSHFEQLPVRDGPRVQQLSMILAQPDADQGQPSNAAQPAPPALPAPQPAPMPQVDSSVLPNDDEPNANDQPTPHSRHRREPADQAVDIEPTSARVVRKDAVVAPDDDMAEQDFAPLGDSLVGVNISDDNINQDNVRNEANIGHTAQLPAIPELDDDIDMPPVDKSAHTTNAPATNVDVSKAHAPSVAPDLQTDSIVPASTDAAKVPSAEADISVDNVVQQAELNEHGLPTSRQSADRPTSALDAAMKKLGKRKSTPKPKKADSMEHTPDPAELIRQALEEHKYVWIDRLGGRPDLSLYYDRIEEMLLERGPEPVDIFRYLDIYDTQATRFSALVALTDKATEGSVSIERYSANGPIRSFRRA